MTQPMEKVRLRPRIWPTFPPVIIRTAMTSVYGVMAVWMPVTSVPRSSATVAMDTFMTELSSVIRNCPAASVSSVAPPADAAVVTSSTSDRTGGSVGHAGRRRGHPRDRVRCPTRHHHLPPAASHSGVGRLAGQEVRLRDLLGLVRLAHQPGVDS